MTNQENRNKFNFTHQKLKSLQQQAERNEIDFGGSSRRVYRDEKVNNFGFRLYQSGTISFFSSYRVNGRKDRYTHGKFPDVSLSDARDGAREINLQVSRGVDPKAEEKIDPEIKRETPETFEQLYEYFSKDYGEQKLADKTFREYDRIVQKYVMDEWRTLNPGDITPDHVRTLMKKVIENCESRDGEIRGHDIPEEFHGNRQANQVRKVINSIYSNTSFEFDNPAKKVPTKKEYERNQNDLSPDQIRALWEALDDEPKPFEVSIKLLLLLGQRRNEVIGMKWSNINEGEHYWTLPPSRTKNDELHVVPLPPLSMSLIESMKDYGDDSKFVFPSPRSETDKSIDVKSFSKVSRRIREHTGLDKSEFRIHALRSTMRTNLAKLDFREKTAKRVMGHIIQSTSNKRYDAYQYLPQKREALMRWEEKVASIAGIDLESIKSEKQEHYQEEVERIKECLQNENLPDDTAREIDIQVETLNTQLSSSDPSDVIIDESRKKIRNLLDDEVGEDKRRKYIE